MDWSDKGAWLPADAVDDAVFVEAGHSLFDGPFTWPVMVARRSAIEANIATMAAYCERHGVDFAPHGKTTMAPTLFAAQRSAGAWAITVATPHQALVARRFGVDRVLLANEVLDPRVLRWIAAEPAEILFYVDSLAGVEALRAAGAGGRVLVEVGYAGGRAGCRVVTDAVAVASAAAAIEGVRVVGVAGFEGLLTDESLVRSFLTDLGAAAAEIAPLCADRPVISAGGSAWFDAVVDVLGPPARAEGWRLVLRSGAVVTHDDGTYLAATPFNRTDEGTLAAALEVWAQVLSTPEPGLAIVGAGRRDVPFDAGLPVPLRARSTAGELRPLPGAVIEAVNDQHAYLRGAPVAVGELVHLGLSHPCTAFDKWRVIPVVDDGYRVVDVLRTYF
jgi:D-serine deaminase-like pyridoxal phosphate-dependent protein